MSVNGEAGAAPMRPFLAFGEWQGRVTTNESTMYTPISFMWAYHGSDV